MRFDNPIYDHGFEFPDLADLPGLENEYRFKDNKESEKDLKLLYTYLNDYKFEDFIIIVEKYSKLKKLYNQLHNMFNFYKDFEKLRKKTKFLDNHILYTEGYYSQKLDLLDLKKSLSTEISNLYKINDWNPPIGQMDRGTKLNENHENLINEILNSAGILELGTKYLGLDKILNVSAAYLIVGKPTDTHWKQFFQDQNYISKTTNMHIDPVEGQLKVMIYLNEVEENSGPFTYIPKSNRWVYDPLQEIFGRAIATGNYCNNPKKRQEIFRLPKKLRVSYNFGRSLVDNHPVQNMLLNKEKQFISQNENVILFDPAGIHKGGICKTKDRIAIQVLLK